MALHFNADELNVARQLLFHYGHPQGYPPGDFHFRLIQALEKADFMNKEKLLSAFPEFRYPVDILQEEGRDKLAEHAKNSSEAMQGRSR